MQQKCDWTWDWSFNRSKIDYRSEKNIHEADVILIGPQIRYELPSKRNRRDIPVEAIDMRDYGMMNGPKVLDQALSIDRRINDRRNGTHLFPADCK